MRRAWASASLPLRRVAGGLRHVDPIGHAVDDVVVERREGGVDQRLRRRQGRVDPVELACRHLQPLAHDGAAHAHRAHRVRIEIEVGDVADRDVARRNVGVVGGPASPARLERRRRRQHRNAVVRRALQHPPDVGGLRARHQLHRRVVLDEREVAVDARRAASHGPPHVSQRARVLGLDGRLDRRIGLAPRAPIDCPGAGGCRASSPSRPPAPSRSRCAVTSGRRRPDGCPRTRP